MSLRKGVAIGLNVYFKVFHHLDCFFRVTKTVDKDSLEAKHMKKEETKKAVPNHSVMPVGCVG